MNSTFMSHAQPFPTSVRSVQWLVGPYLVPCGRELANACNVAAGDLL
jgi:hypothetical protein